MHRRARHSHGPDSSDAWLVAALAVGPIGLSLLAPTSAAHRELDFLGWILVAASLLALLWRRIAPVRVLAVAGLVVTVNAAAGYPVSAVQWPAWIALYSCFAWRGWRTRTVGLAVVGLGIGGYWVFDRGPVGPGELASIAVCVLVAGVTGDAARTRRAYAEAIEARLRTEARLRVEERERAVREERTRWARELHDAVGHAVNVMVMQAGVGRRVFAENPDFAQDALRHIETVGREALDELDRLLRAEDSTEPGTVADLSTLVDRVRSAGRDVELDVGDVALSPSTSRALYRIVQEAVTNALRHTAAGRIRVELSQAGDSIVVQVHNVAEGLRAPVPGRGLANMGERARLEGGSFEAGLVEGGFRVRATLPARPGGDREPALS